MKTVLKKMWLVLHEAIKFIIGIVVLALMAAVLTLGLALIPLMAIAQSVTEGGTLFDNMSDLFIELINKAFNDQD